MNSFQFKCRDILYNIIYIVTYIDKIVKYRALYTFKYYNSFKLLSLILFIILCILYTFIKRNKSYLFLFLNKYITFLKHSST